MASGDAAASNRAWAVIRYSGSRAAISSTTSRKPPVVSVGRRSAVSGSVWIRGHTSSGVASSHATKPLAIKRSRFSARNTTPPPVAMTCF